MKARSLGNGAVRSSSCRRALRVVAWTGVAASVGFPLAITIVSPWYRVSINRSDSLPGLLYVIDVGTAPACGEVFALDMPGDAAHYAGKRLLKIALGCLGSVVTRHGDRFRVDGRDAGVAKRTARNGESLAPGPVGTLPPNTWFAWTPHPDSYDSRYASFGWVGTDRLVGRAWRLF